ncbi:uncharacterized protein LOC134190803 [Corticium candelabrum]|uniref:uncharacterized protein LOC134190803 n=1 Tax=Corticium candelabrum TaxID=121492 RepID=UPI002E269145|nr:uncharacterized protein LOC134190803 [Corticium candelabrum]
MFSAPTLSAGWPASVLLSKAASYLTQAASDALMKTESDGVSLLEYGPVEGLSTFREVLAAYLSKEYQDDVHVDSHSYYIFNRNDLFITCGATYGLYLLATLFFHSGDMVFMEEASYHRVATILGDELKLQVIPVSMDKCGILTEDLKKVVEKTLSTVPRKPASSLQSFRAMLYLIPIFHNPTGICLSHERCREVIDIARKNDLLVVCDDVYNLLSYTDEKYPRLFSYDKKDDPDYQGNVVSVGTFSKIFGPGIRVGWLEGPQCVLSYLKTWSACCQRSNNLSLFLLEFLNVHVYTQCSLSSSGSPNHCMSGILERAIGLGLQHQLLTEARAFYKRNMSAMCQVLEKSLPPSVKFTKPKGGYFVWITMPKHVCAEDVVQLCDKEYGVVVNAGHILVLILTHPCWF